MSEDEQPVKEEDGYTVGYGKPPTRSRFKPGKSGNPKGKQKGSRSFKTTVSTIFNEKIKVHTPRGIKRMTKLEALVHTSLNNALKGDAKAVDQVLRIAREAGLANEIVEALDTLTLQQLNDEDKAIRALRRSARWRRCSSK